MIEPLGDRILIKQDKVDSKSQIIITSDEPKILPSGNVLKVGNGQKMYFCGVAPGDKVYFNEYSGERIDYEGQEYLILNLSEILAKCSPNTEN